MPKKVTPTTKVILSKEDGEDVAYITFRTRKEYICVRFALAYIADLQLFYGDEEIFLIQSTRSGIYTTDDKKVFKVAQKLSQEPEISITPPLDILQEYGEVRSFTMRFGAVTLELSTENKMYKSSFVTITCNRKKIVDFEIFDPTLLMLCMAY